MYCKDTFWGNRTQSAIEFVFNCKFVCIMYVC